MRSRSLVITVILVALLAINAGVASAQQQRTYVVQPGDSLFAIASRFNVSVSELATINRTYDINSLFVGQVLTLPNSATSTTTTQTQPTTGTQFGTGGAISPITTQPVFARPIFTPAIVSVAPGSTITTTVSYTGYVVRQGDFLATIAQRFNTSIDALLAANQLANPDLIYTGQLLTIPRTTTTTVPVTSTVRAVPAASGRVYIVQPGDNLFSIAARSGRNAWDIARANGITDLNTVFVGQPILIP